MKIKAFIFDYIPDNAFISQQLGLNSLTDLFLGKSSYTLEQSFPSVKHHVTFEVFKEKMKSGNDLEIKEVLKEYDRVVLWPLNQKPHDLADAAKVLSDALETYSCKVQVGDEFAYILTGVANDELLVLPSSIEAINLAAQDSHLSVFAFASPSRSFNHLEIDENTVIKLCDDKVKGMAEAHFLNLVPSSVQKYFPTLISSLESGRGFSYQIPRYEMLDLSRFLLHGSLKEGEWRGIFQNVDEYFKTCPKKVVGQGTVRESLRKVFIEKLKARAQVYRVMQSALNIDSLVEELIEKLDYFIGKYQADCLVFSHGDLCFSNMLLDRRTQEMKFVDARGAMSLEETFLPIEYDFAKLSHCVHGRYDWIMAQNLERPYQNEQHQILQKEFAQLMANHSVSPELVCLGEASLFLSMLPLHMDQPHLHPAMIQSAKLAMARYLELAHAS